MKLECYPNMNSTGCDIHYRLAAFFIYGCICDWKWFAFSARVWAVVMAEQTAQYVKLFLFSFLQIWRPDLTQPHFLIFTQKTGIFLRETKDILGDIFFSTFCPFYLLSILLFVHSTICRSTVLPFVILPFVVLPFVYVSFHREDP